MTVREQVRQLWQDVFDDDESFTNIYFSRIYNDAINYSVEYDGKVVAALQAIPFDFKAGDRVLKTAYLSGIATDRSYRRRGFMRQLLDKTHNSLQLQSYDTAWLIPAEDYLFDIYSAFGYKTAFYKDYKTVERSSISARAIGIEIVGVLDKNDMGKVYDYFSRKQMLQNSGVILPKDFFSVVVDVFDSESNPIMVAKRHQTIVGIAFVLSQGKIIKMFADNSEIEQAFFTHIVETLPTKEITLKTNDKAIPYGMMLTFDKNIKLPIEPLADVSLMLDE